MVQLGELQEYYGQFQAAGVRVYAVSVDPPGQNARLKARLGADYEFLSDEQGELLDALDIRQARRSVTGQDTAIPTQYLLDREGGGAVGLPGRDLAGSPTPARGAGSAARVDGPRPAGILGINRDTPSLHHLHPAGSVNGGAGLSLSLTLPARSAHQPAPAARYGKMLSLLVEAWLRAMRVAASALNVPRL